MFGLLLTLLILDSLMLMGVVLLQSGKGGGLAAMGGGASTDTFVGGRHAVTILTKLSWWGGAIFLVLSLILAGMSSRGGAPRSIIEGQVAPPQPVPPLPLDDALPVQGEQGGAAGTEEQTPPPGGN